MSKVRPLCRYCLVQRRSINFTICAQIYAQMVKSMPNQRLMSRCRVKADLSRSAKGWVLSFAWRRIVERCSAKADIEQLLGSWQLCDGHLDVADRTQ